MKPRAAITRVFTIAAILAAALWAGVASAQTTTVAGASPGSLSVGATGQAGYDIPIAVPPGIAGMQPNLSLSYSSGAGNGIAGMGWSISGLSSIKRCPRTPAQDGQWGAIEYGPNDRFCLGGSRLVAVSGAYGGDGTEYRTEIDGFSRIVSYGKVAGSTGVLGSSPLWFRVWTKSGRIMDFGATADSRAEVVRAVAPAAGEPVEIKRWAVDRVADSAGNYLTLGYFEDPATGAHRIDRIDYTFNDAAAVSAQSSVRFLYEARPDITRGYPSGSLTTLDVRLGTVQTWTDGVQVHDYRLAYETGAATGRSRLTSVTECDSGGNCLAPHVFGWKAENAGFTSAAGYKLPFIPPEGVDEFDDGAFVDVNGDGLQDFVAAVDDKFGPPFEHDYRITWLNTGANWEISPEHQPPFDIKVFELPFAGGAPSGRRQGEFVDVDGDGLKDFVRAARIGLENYTSQRTTWLNTGSGWVESAAHQAPFDIFFSYKRALDDCGDSYVASCINTEGHYYNARSGEFVDLNGDGLLDFVQAVEIEEYTERPVTVFGGQWKPKTYLNAWINTGAGWTLSPEYVPPTTLRKYWSETVEKCINGECTDVYYQLAINMATFSDVDSDNLPDYLQSYQILEYPIPFPGYPPEVTVTDVRTTWLNTGGGWAPSSEYTAPVGLWVYDSERKTTNQEGRLADVNGDGLVDFVQASDRAGQTYQTTWVNTGEGWAVDPDYKPTFVFYSEPLSFFFLDSSFLGWNNRKLRSGLSDVNGDGLPDAVTAYQTADGVYRDTWLNTGNGWELDPAYKPPYLLYGGDNLYGGGKQLGFYVDLNGDGLDDLVRHDVAGRELIPEDRETWLTNSSAPDQLLTITDSLGATTALDYAPLTDKAVYAKHADAVFPARDIQPSRQVVSEVARDDGVGGQYRTAYAYAGAKIDLTGRGIGSAPIVGPDDDNTNAEQPGFQEAAGLGSPGPAGPGYLGFRYVAATDLQTGIVSTRRFAQDYPYIGLAEHSVSLIPDPGGLTAGTRIAETTRTFAQRPLNAGANLFRYLSQSVTETFEPAHGHGNLPITTATTTADYDDYGNPRDVVTTTAGGGETFTTAAANTYTNDIANWFIGRLTRAAVTRTLPDLRSATRVNAFDYDPLTGLLAREVVEPDSLTLKLTTDYTRDAFGHVATTTVSGPDIATRSSSADYPAGAPHYGRFATTVTNALGHEETRTFDARFGAVASLTDPNGITTSWEYDGFGRQTRENRADGTATVTAYDLCAAQCPAGGVYAVAAQNVIAGIDPAPDVPYDARKVSYQDLLDRAFRGESQGFDGTPVYADTLFNALGQVEYVSRPYFAGTLPADIQWKVTTYDDVGRVETITRPDGGVTSTAYDGLTTTVTNPLGQTQASTRDATGQTASTVDNAGTATTFSYDPFGNLEQTNAGGVVTAMTYDIRGRKRTMDDPDMGAWSYDYDALGELTGQTDAKLQTATLAYDKLGRMTTRTEAEGITTWAYDNAFKAAGIGRPDGVSRTQDDYAEDYLYDSIGRPVETTATYEARDYAYTTTYDDAGRPATLTYPAAGDTSRFAVENGYNALGYHELTREFGGAGTVYWQAMTVDAEGRITEESLGNGLTGRRDFDPASGLVSDIRVYAGLTAIKDHGFRFDLVGNLEFREDRLGARREDFIHDGLNRLTAATVIDSATLGQLGETTASYDPLGNITFKSDVGVYAYEGLAAGPHAVTRAGNVDYAYDANGNMASSAFVDTSAAHRAFAWSSFNKPTRMENSVTGAASEFTYGPSRARIKQTTLDGATVTKTTTYIGGDFERIAPAAGADELVHYIRAGGERVAIFTHVDDGVAVTDKTRYLHKDHLGSIDLVTDEAGLAADTRSFDAWGKPRNADWTPAPADPPLTETPRGFTDHEHIQTVGLIHMNGRVQDPVLGRFISPDPSDALNPGVGFNRYAYALNNPLSLVDPDGFQGRRAPNMNQQSWRGWNNQRQLSAIQEAIQRLDPNYNTTSVRAPNSEITRTEINEARRDLERMGREAAERELEKTERSCRADVNQNPGINGRRGRQERLRELAKDGKLSAADRGWLNQEINAVNRGNRGSIRNPPGRDLAHERGREAAKGYGYKHSNLKNRMDHRKQHKYDNYGRANKERPVPEERISEENRTSEREDRASDE